MEYKKKQRPQKIRMLDGSVKTVMVDDSKTVGELLVTICSRIGKVKGWLQRRSQSMQILAGIFYANSSGHELVVFIK